MIGIWPSWADVQIKARNGTWVGKVSRWNIRTKVHWIWKEMKEEFKKGHEGKTENYRGERNRSRKEVKSRNKEGTKIPWVGQRATQKGYRKVFGVLDQKSKRFDQ